MSIRLGSRQSVQLLALAGLLIYIGWIGAPYLRSVLLRDAAVTTWINVTSSPIRGYVDARPLYPGERVGTDRRIATIEDVLADRTPVARAEAELERAQDRLQALEELAGILERTTEARTLLARDYATAFKADLDARISSATSRLAYVKQQLALERIQSNRLAKLAASGHAAQAAADQEASDVADLQRRMIEIQAELDRASLRRHDAEHGTLLLDDGTDAAIAARAVDEAEIGLSRARSDIVVAKVEVDSDRSLLAVTTGLYEKARRVDVQAPQDAMVWSLMTAPGSAVQPGMPVASWIDCKVMLVDAPVSDVVLALLPMGAEANVVLEGEKRVRRGRVVLTRGAASTVGREDLAALAKGRYPGLGQVLVKLEATPEDVEACPIGDAAHVDFPEVGLFDILRARLRL